MTGAIAEQRAVREPGEVVVERLVPDLLVEPRVLEQDAGLVGHRLGERDLAIEEWCPATCHELDGADRLAIDDHRDLEHESTTEPEQETHLAGVGLGVAGVDYRDVPRREDSRGLG